MPHTVEEAPRNIEEVLSDHAKSRMGLARHLLPKRTIGYVPKLQKLTADPTAPTEFYLTADGDAHIFAESVLVELLRKLRRDAGMMEDWWGLMRFFAYMLLFLCVVSLQLSLFSTESTATYGAIRDWCFEFSDSVVSDVTHKDIREGLASWSAFELFVESYVSRIFEEETCGDGLCRDQDEMPTWFISDDARADDFAGCTADCGTQKTARVAVNFFDAFKLQEHAKLARNTIADGEFCGGGECFPIDSWDRQGYEKPTAGWNVCHRHDKELGINATVCVFDGDIFVGGLPFRTHELEVDSGDFGGAAEIDLYDGDWELRYTFVGFEWLHPRTRQPYYVGFPALRGSVCVAEENCTLWSACPDAKNCLCEFKRGSYSCPGRPNEDGNDKAGGSVVFADEPIEVQYLRLDEPSYDDELYRRYAGIETVAKWWDVQGFHGSEIAEPLIIDNSSLSVLKSMTARMSDSFDDGEEAGDTGFVSTESLQLRLGYDGDATVIVATRFVTPWPVQRRAKIVSATITFQCADTAESEPLDILIRGLATFEPPQLATSTSEREYGSISKRPLTERAVLWKDVPACVPGSTIMTPELALIVQDLVDANNYRDSDYESIFAFSFEPYKNSTSAGFASSRFVYAYDPLLPRRAAALDLTYVRMTSVSLSVDRPVDDVTEHLIEGSVFAWGDLSLGSIEGLDVIHGLRFNRVPLFPNETILGAWLGLTARFASGDGEELRLAIRGEASDDSQQFGSVIDESGPYFRNNETEHYSVEANFNLPRNVLTSRSVTEANVVARIPPFSAGAVYDTPDLKAIIQEVVAGPGWADNSSITLFLFPMPQNQSIQRDVMSCHRETGRDESTSPTLRIWTIGQDAPLTPAPTESAQPTPLPTELPTPEPTAEPTARPTTPQPSPLPSLLPTDTPTPVPTDQPTTTEPTLLPSAYPTICADRSPPGVCITVLSLDTSACVTRYCPSCKFAFACDKTCGYCESELPSPDPTPQPTVPPTSCPTEVPTPKPSGPPSVLPTGEPSSSPSSNPSALPTSLPSAQPSSLPSAPPSSLPSAPPSSFPSEVPSSLPSGPPSSLPSALPSLYPSAQPTSLYKPTSAPSPIYWPTLAPVGWLLADGNPDQDCAWVALDPEERCDEIGIDGVEAANACRDACPQDDDGPTRRRQLFGDIEEAHGRMLQDGEADVVVSIHGTQQATVVLTMTDAFTKELVFAAVSDGGNRLYSVQLNASRCYEWLVGETTLPAGFTWTLRLPDGESLFGPSPFGPEYIIGGFGDGWPLFVLAPSCTSGPSELIHQALNSTYRSDDDSLTLLGDVLDDSPGRPLADVDATFPPSSVGVSSLECYTTYQGTRPLLPTTSYTTCTRTGLYDALATTESCEASETKCAYFEWATTSENGLCSDFLGLGGCLSSFEAKLGYSIGHGDNYLSDDDCDRVGASIFDGATKISKCAVCGESLCTSQDPSWYSNQFKVPTRAVSIAEHGVDSRFLEALAEAASPNISALCPKTDLNDDSCEEVYNHLACNYDNGSCCRDRGAVAGTDYSCRVPWFLNHDDPDVWDYAVIKQETVHATVPAMLYRIVLEVIALQIALIVDASVSSEPNFIPFNETTPTYDIDTTPYDKYIPSLACPDCSRLTASGDYVSVPFEVNVRQDNAVGYGDWHVKDDPSRTCATLRVNNTNDVDSCQLLGQDASVASTRCAECGAPFTNRPQFSIIDPGKPRDRYMTQPNVIVYGPLLVQKRADGRVCRDGRPFNSKLDYLDDPHPRCHLRSNENRGAFGVDATFDASSSTYRSTNEDNVYLYYDPSELDMTTGQPYGFTYDMGSDGKARDYPIYWDVNMNRSRALEIVQLLVDGEYFDDFTKSVRLTTIAVNRDQSEQLIAVVQMRVQRDTAGGLEFSYSIQLVDTNPYDGGIVDFFRLVLEVFFLLMLTYMILHEAFELWVAYSENEGRWGFMEYFKSPGNCLDLTSYLLALITVFRRVRYLTSINDLSPDLHYEVYKGANWLDWNRRTARIVQYNENIEDLQAAIEEFEALAKQLIKYKLWVMFCMIIIVFQLLKVFHFHPKLGLVTRTVTKAGGSLLFWFVLQGSIALLYSLLGVLLFSQSSKGFGTRDTPGILQAFTGFAFLSLAGMYDPSELDDIPGLEDISEGLSFYISQLFFWSYMMISFFIMFNALLAIIVAAYVVTLLHAA